LNTGTWQRHGAGWQESAQERGRAGRLDGGAGAIRGGNEREVNVVRILNFEWIGKRRTMKIMLLAVAILLMPMPIKPFTGRAGTCRGGT